MRLRRSVCALIGCGIILAGVAAIRSVGAKAETPGSVLVCVNPQSGASRVMLSGGSCQPGFVPLQLASAGSGGGSSAGPRYLDANDNEVGIFAGANSAIRQVGDIWISMRLAQDGLLQDGFTFYYTSPDCTGSAYMETTDSPMIVEWTFAVGTTLYYPGAAGEPTTIYSYRWANGDGTPSDCIQEELGGFTEKMAIAASVDLATLQLQPPFRLVID